MSRRVSRFERQILTAVFLAGVTPFVISLIFMPLIVETHFALSVHHEVVEQLEASALFYREFFDAKKQEFAARAETIARDPILVERATAEHAEDVQARLAQLLEDHDDISRAKVVGSNDEVLAEVVGTNAKLSDFIKKTLILPLGLGEESPRIEVEFLLPERYMQDRAKAEEISTLYGTAVKMGTRLEQEKLETYIGLTTAVLLLALGIGFFLARQVTKRVATLASATERVGRGDLEFQIAPKGSDEITELADAFNKMIAEIREARDRIVYLEKVSGWQEFARRLAHEIKNPLTPIQLAIQELRRRTPESDPAFRKLVDDSATMVEEEISALTRLVDEFSQFARLPEVVPDEVELKEFVEEVLNAYNRFESEASIEVDLPDEPLFVALDRVLMKRVLANLAENAIQASQPEHAHIFISATRRKDGYTVMTVEDDGPGVPEDQVGRIFDPYFTTKPEGTGLGLAIVKKFVLQHGGTISLSRSQHGGAAFAIVFPPKELVLGNRSHEPQTEPRR